MQELNTCCKCLLLFAALTSCLLFFDIGIDGFLFIRELTLSPVPSNASIVDSIEAREDKVSQTVRNNASSTSRSSTQEAEEISSRGEVAAERSKLVQKANLCRKKKACLPCKTYKSTADPSDLSEISLDGCVQIYLDIGSNIGVQVRKLFEPHKYPESPVLDIFNTVFGTPKHRSRPSSESGLCAVGFEANPARARRLHEVEAAYRKQGWKVHFFVPRPVSEVGGQNVTLSMDPNSDPGGLGASIFSWDNHRKGNVQTIVKTIDISTWIQRVVTGRHIPHRKGVSAYVLAKMDIEGSEYTLLPRMMEEGLLCSGVIDEIFMEWHKPTMENFPGRSGMEARSKGKSVDKCVKFHLYDNTRCLPRAITKASKLDDEMYFEDGQPLP